ncbi:hypothetical protein E2C01_056631 [Portunus trituberculatus]|uniref:Uncharacterized protein n=1 Tax=Portunus trituberculatus TaxID=210409 RepID=A0A5B7GY93_PORTR|nr:hypothetical protein [Portunus trituberculatus]
MVPKGAHLPQINTITPSKNLLTLALQKEYGVLHLVCFHLLGYQLFTLHSPPCTTTTTLLVHIMIHVPVTPPALTTNTCTAIRIFP